MLDLAVIDDGDGLEAAMRMLSDTKPPFRRLEIVWTCIVEQQEGTDMRAQGGVGEE